MKQLSVKQRRWAKETGLDNLLNNKVVNLHANLITWHARSFDAPSMRLKVYRKVYAIAPGDVIDPWALQMARSHLILPVSHLG